uniref:UAS domain-containing protein n=1 Tax=Steinernema glaseri TaxID=37863 RepID=A0A1I7YY81_9BILA
MRDHDELQAHFQFGWLDGNQIANSIVLGEMPVPSVLVFNYSSYEYFLSNDSPEQMTPQSLLTFLETINSSQAQGGRSLSQRVRRMIYEVTTNVYDMFANQPILTSCLFGVPLAFLSIITYSICSSDFSVDRESIYPEDEEEYSDTEEQEELLEEEEDGSHEKRE